MYGTFGGRLKRCRRLLSPHNNDGLKKTKDFFIHIQCTILHNAHRWLCSLSSIQTLTFIVLTAVYDVCSRQRRQLDWWVQCTMLGFFFYDYFCNSRWSQADPCYPDSCSGGCGPWCDGGTVCPERCLPRRLPWWSPRSDWGVSWGVRKEKNIINTTIRASKHTSQCCCPPVRQSATGNSAEERKKKQRVTFLPFQKATVPLLEKMTFREIYNWI